MPWWKTLEGKHSKGSNHTPRGFYGIVNGDDFRISYSDTPGYTPRPHYKLQEAMFTSTLDIGYWRRGRWYIYVTDVNENPQKRILTYTRKKSRHKTLDTPLIVCNQTRWISPDTGHKLETVNTNMAMQIYPHAEIVPGIHALHGIQFRQKSYSSYWTNCHILHRDFEKDRH